MTDGVSTTTRPREWTQDESGRSNSSEAFEALIEEVARLIRQEAHFLLAGDTESAARLIMAQLAHKHGLAPRSGQLMRLARAIVDLHDGTPDHACAQCVPGGPIVDPDFVCAFHESAALLEETEVTG